MSRKPTGQTAGFVTPRRYTPTARSIHDESETMYEGYFHLKVRPFDLAPDPRFLFMSPQHSRAAANVRFALMNHDSFVIITGEIGTGKTTVLNAALDELGPQFVSARLVHTTLSDVELLQALLSEFGIANYGTKRVRLLDALRAHFLEQHTAGRHVVIIVDEAQHLSPAALEELRLLSCIDAHDRRIVSIVLTGQPSLDEVLDAPAMAQLRQRTRLRQRLRPMREAETAAYIGHRLQVAGGDAVELFEPDALKEIHRLTLGIPRLINTLCDTALMACMVDSAFKVTVDTLQKVVEELGWRWSELEDQQSSPRPAGSAGAVRPGPGGKATLSVYTSGTLRQQVEITGIPFSIGRGQGNALVIGEREVSRRHALIDCVGERYVVEDLNSINGIAVNYKSRDSAVLKSGDVITIGHVDIVFHLAREPGESAGDTDRTECPVMDVDADTGRNALRFTETQRITEELSNVVNVAPTRK